MAKQQQSLAAKSGALSKPEFTLPSVFQRAPVPIEARSIAPYIVFAHPKRADEWAKIAAKCGTPNEHDMYLIRKEGPLHLPVAKVSWLCHQQYWAYSNAAGSEIIAVSYDEKPKPFKEHVEAVVLVYLPDGTMTPANWLFRSTKCPAAKVMSDALVEAHTSDWPEKSPAHKASMACSEPFMRFYGLVTMGDKRTGRDSGMPYIPTRCEMHPTGIPEWQQLKAFMDVDNYGSLMQGAAERFEYRLAEIAKKAPKE